MSALLPLPEDQGGPTMPFAKAVDAYAAEQGVSRAETFRRIAAVTGNTPGGLALRYRDRGDRVWRWAAPFQATPVLACLDRVRT